MKIDITRNDSVLNVALEGRLDTLTAPELDKAMKDNLSGVTEIRYDFGKLEYVSSAGLRVMTKAHQNMAYGGKTVVANANEIVLKVLDITGLATVFVLE